MSDEEVKTPEGKAANESGGTVIKPEALPAAEPPAAAPAVPAAAASGKRSSLSWKLLGADAPESEDDGRKLAVTRAFQKMWVAGTVGAFFSSIARALPVNVEWFVARQSWENFGDLLLRYFYMLWLLSYFLVSSVGLDRPSYKPSRKDIWYDVLQSFGAFLAAYFLGFLKLDTSYGWIKFVMANGVIFVICALSLYWFHENATAGVNRLRIYGTVISLAAVFIPCVPVADWVRRSMFLGTYAVLVWVLVMYIRIRRYKDEYPSRPARVA